MRYRTQRWAVPALLGAGVLGLLLALNSGGTAGVAAQNNATTTATGTATASCPVPPMGANGQHPAPPRPADGTITAINGATFTLSGNNGATYTIATDANTHYDTSVTANLSTVAVGDFVMVQGTKAADGNVAATALTDNGTPMAPPVGQPPMGQSGGPPMMHPAGTAPAGTHPAGTAPAGTHVPTAGCAPPRPQGTPGTRPAGTPPTRQNGTPPAGRNGTPPAGGNPGTGPNPGNFTGGVVQAINGTTLTLKGRDGATITVTTTASTVVKRHQAGAFASLKVGDHVSASAAPNSGSAANATSFTAARVSDRGA